MKQSVRQTITDAIVALDETVERLHINNLQGEETQFIEQCEQVAVHLRQARKLKSWLLEHHHRHGSSVYFLQSERELDEQDAIKFLGEEFEPDRDDEWIELSQVDPTIIS